MSWSASPQPRIRRRGVSGPTNRRRRSADDPRAPKITVGARARARRTSRRRRGSWSGEGNLGRRGAVKVKLRGIGDGGGIIVVVDMEHG